MAVGKNARNQALFRDVNQEIASVSRRWGGRMQVLCECGELGCGQLLLITQEDYGRVRKDPTLFVLAPSHAGDAMTEVERGERYIVVRDVGEAAA